MGHTRLGRPPTTRRWKAVVATFADAANEAAGSTEFAPPLSVSNLARQAVEAAHGGLERAAEDEGLRYSFFLLTQIALASRSDRGLDALKRLGFTLHQDAGFFDLLAEFQGCVDDHLLETGAFTDVAELAKQAAADALSGLASERAQTLFGEDQTTVQAAIRPLSTRVGFGRLGQRFFGTFLARYLNFYLSRISASHVGTGSLPQLGDLLTLNGALARHCQESAVIVRDFAGEWYSKTEYLHGISPTNVPGFVAVALAKLRAELAQQRDE